VILVGKSAEDKLIKRLVSGTGACRCPPPAEEIGVLRAWIDQGADFRLKVRPEAPPKPVAPKLVALFDAIRAGQSVDVDARLIRQWIRRDLRVCTTPRTKPLAWALDSEAKVSLLLAKSAASDARRINGRMALYQAASIGGGAEIVKLLLDNGAKPNAALVNGRTPLIGVPAVALLLAHGADPKIESKRKETALADAGTSGGLASVQMLIDRGAMINAPDRGVTRKRRRPHRDRRRRNRGVTGDQARRYGCGSSAVGEGPPCGGTARPRLDLHGVRGRD
jgi:ankyrin repeat protein